MATLVIHGTMTGAGPSHSTWWWNSRHEGGFLDALAGGLTDAGGVDDVWRVAGRPVHEIPELCQRGLAQHQGHFQWGGADMPDTRRAGSEFLAAYINRILQISPREPIRLVAHSHGCNVVKGASAVPLLSPVARFPRVAFLACPHFMGQGHRGPVFHHRLSANRFGRILNLFSDSDTVQTTIAGAMVGPFGACMDDYSPPDAYRTEQDSAAQGLYENWRIPTADQGTSAHTAMHGLCVGYLVGRWLAGESFQPVVDSFAARVLPVPRGDFGS